MNRAARARVHAALGDEHRLQIVDELYFADRTPRELGESLALPSNLLAHHLNVLEDAGLIGRVRSDGDRRRRYVKLVAAGLGAASHPGLSTDGTSVLFVCTHNSARSQFAAARWRERTGGRAQSAGTDPAERVDPLAVAVGHELGVDLSDASPGGYETITASSDLVISVCDRARESSMPFRGRHLHWSVPDPVGGRGRGPFRAAFTEIDQRIETLAVAIERKGSG